MAWVSGICGKDGGGTDSIRGWGYVVEDEKSAGIMKVCGRDGRGTGITRGRGYVAGMKDDLSRWRLGYVAGMVQVPVRRTGGAMWEGWRIIW